MNYRHVYCKIISYAKSQEKLGLRKRGNGEYYERHHILPKSLFPLWVKDKRNMVLLTSREHFFCHQLLYKIYPCKEMNYALFYMSICKKDGMKLSSKQYEKIRLEYSSYKSDDMKGENNTFYGKRHSEETRKHWSEIRKGKGLGADNPMFGKTHSDEAKQKLREANLGSNNPMFGKHLSEEAKRKISEKHKGLKHLLGRKWYTNGVECVIAKECPEGFWPGRIIKKRSKSKYKC